MSAEALQQQIEQLRELVSPRVGIIRELVRIPRGDDEPIPPMLYRATLANFDFRTAPPEERSSAGKGLTELEAIGGAIGEAIERYCAAHPITARVERARPSAVSANAVRPEDCVLFSKSQYDRPGFPYAPPSDNQEIDWYPVIDLSSGETVLAPAAFIPLNPAPRSPAELLCLATSNGLAAGPDLPTAVLRGLCELVERDGFLVHWMNRLSPPEVLLPDDGSVIGDMVAHYARFGVEAKVFDISTELPVSTMMAVTLDRTGTGPAAAFALGSDLDPQRAVLKSLFEMCQVRPGIARTHLASRQERMLRDYQEVHTLEDHSSFFANPAHLAELDFLLGGDRRCSLADLPRRSLGSAEADLAACVAGITTAGYRALFADLTTDDLADFPIRVVRTIAPGLQPMHFGIGQERLGGRRLFEAPVRLGYASSPRSEADLNPCPHPLA